MARRLYVEARIAGSMDRLWELTQVPSLHERWDLRFTSITYLPRTHDAEPQRFEYITRIGLGLEIAGLGESLATREGAAGVRSSSLRFWSESPLSLITEGSGYWRYVPLENAAAETIRFLTWYDYRTRFGLGGRAADLIFRPLMGWATAWSFDRLRLWIEHDLPPEAVRTCSLIYTVARLSIVFVWLWHGLVPKLLFRDAGELAMLQQSGLSTRWLPWVGAAEMVVALAGLLLWRSRSFLVFTAVAMLGALVQVALRSPTTLTAAFNPVTLNLSVFALAVVAWCAWPGCAFASRCLRRAPASEGGSA